MPIGQNFENALLTHFTTKMQGKDARDLHMNSTMLFYKISYKYEYNPDIFFI